MAKIENEAETPPARHVFEILVSFDSLAVGATWAMVPDEWTDYRVGVGYLEDHGEETADVRSEASPG